MRFTKTTRPASRASCTAGHAVCISSALLPMRTNCSPASAASFSWLGLPMPGM